MLHVLAALLLYLLSTPQFVQDVALDPEYFPPGHAVLTDVPAQVYPAVHALHFVCVVEPPPHVKRVLAQVEQKLLPIPL